MKFVSFSFTLPSFFHFTAAFTLESKYPILFYVIPSFESNGSDHNKQLKKNISLANCFETPFVGQYLNLLYIAS